MSQPILSHLQDIFLWLADAPGSEGLSFEERVVERSPEPDKLRDREVTQVRRPRLTPYLPQKANGAAVILAPGGGYQRQAIDKEGAEIAIWLNAHGYTVFVLRYRLPAEGHLQGSDVPLQDAQRAVRLVRCNAAAWGLKPNSIVAMGCSAGGHVMASLATGFDKGVYDVDDDSQRGLMALSSCIR